MSVTLRERALSKGKISFLLDIYNPHTKERSYEFLFKCGPKENLNDKRKIANAIRGQREIELITLGNDFLQISKKKISLHQYLDKYQQNYDKKDLRVIVAVIKKIKEFIPNKNFYLTDLTENHIIKFVDFLNDKCNFSGETPASYYGRFKKIIINANRENLISERVYKNVRFKAKTESSNTRLTKQVLNEDEIKLLFNVDCGNQEVKRAFLFSCYTGLGISEIKRLKWDHVVNGRLIISRSKTGTEINNKLSETAKTLLGEKSNNEEFIFKIDISDNAINKNLKYWLKRAGIAKHITFYSGRHTFATRLLINGTNLKTVSDSLAHKSIENTIKYLNYVNSLKDDATSGLE